MQRVIVDGLIRIPLDADPEFLALVRGHCTFEDPRRRKSYARGGRDEEFSTICAAREEDGHLVVPRGIWSDVRDAAKQTGVDLEWHTSVVSVSTRRLPPGEIRIDGKHEPRDYQTATVEQLLARVQLLVRMPPGAGKTITGALAIRASGESALVLCPTEDIAGQWVTACRSVGLENVRMVTSLGGGRLPSPGDVIIAASARALQSRPELLRSIGMLVVDEAHHAGSRSWGRLVGDCWARFRLALSATPDRPDGWDVALPFLFGSYYEAISFEELNRRGLLDRPLVVGVATGWENPRSVYPDVVRCPSCGVVREFWPPEKRGACPSRRQKEPGGPKTKCGHDLDAVQCTRGRMNWTKAVAAMSVDANRTGIAIRIARECARLKRLTLLLVGRVDQCEEVAASLRRIGVVACAATGQLKKSERADMMDDFRARRFSVLVATQLADEGLDVPTLDAVINTAAGKSHGRATQRAGRTTRPTGRRPIYFDLVDKSSEFARQWLGRLTGYREEYGDDAIYSIKPTSEVAALGVLASLEKK